LDHKNDLNQNIELCYVHKLCMELMPFFFNTLITLFTLILGGQRYIFSAFELKVIRRGSERITEFHENRQSTCAMQINEDGNGVWAARCFLGHSEFVKWIGTDLFVVVYDTSRIVVLKLVPCVVLFLLTIQLIRAIKTADNIAISMHRHRSTSHKGSSVTKTTVMLTVIIVMFLVAQLPSVVITGCLKLSDFQPSFAFSICENPHLYAIANIIIIGVHPITFAVYMLMSRRFRRSLRRIIAFRVVAKAEDAFFWSATRANVTDCRVSLNGLSERVNEVTLLRR
uniref:G_PROTEIN_RECEP_F1_2 domain-containing protein n=1 Tax=Anisakis simplex TaxID=6269 RepID=A0A0M3K157_ANISI